MQEHELEQEVIYCSECGVDKRVIAKMMEPMGYVKYLDCGHCIEHRYENESGKTLGTD